MKLGDGSINLGEDTNTTSWFLPILAHDLARVLTVHL